MAVQPIRDMFAKVSNKLILSGKYDKAETILDMAFDIMPRKNFYNISFLRSANEFAIIEMIEQYLRIGKNEKAIAIAWTICRRNHPNGEILCHSMAMMSSHPRNWMQMLPCSTMCCKSLSVTTRPSLPIQSDANW